MINKGLERVAGGIYRIPVAHPLGEPTNVYLIEDRNLTLIDLAHSSLDCLAAITDALKELNHTWKDVRQVIYTHPHLDHMGGGIHLSNYPWIRQISHHQAVTGKYGFGSYQRSWQNMVTHFLTKYPELVREMDFAKTQDYIRRFFPDVGKIRIDVTVGEGDLIELGERSLRVFFTPGHSPQHIILYEPEQKLLFSGDFLLSKGPTVINLSGGNPALYRKSLFKFKKLLADGLEVNKILPGHGPVLFNSSEAVDAELFMLDHQRQRILNVLAGEPKTFAAITRGYFGELEKYDFLGMLLGVVDTLLDWLLAEKLVEVEQGKDAVKRFAVNLNPD